MNANNAGGEQGKKNNIMNFISDLILKINKQFYYSFSGMPPQNQVF